MRIDIWSDLVCPWCYIGKRRLERALAELPDAPQVDIVHRSFQLNPSALTSTTSSRRDYLRAKYGWSPGQAAKIDADMEQRAAADGLEYHLTADGLTGNTFDAHRLVHLARQRGRQDATVALASQACRSSFSTDVSGCPALNRSQLLSKRSSRRRHDYGPFFAIRVRSVFS